jgi:hypothetical protein
MYQDDKHWPVNLSAQCSLIEFVPATSSHFTRQQPTPAPSRLLRSLTSLPSTRPFHHHTTQQQTTTKEISITTQQRPSATAFDLLDRNRYSNATTLGTFGRSLCAHWQKKSDRLFAPVAFPSQVAHQGHNKLQQPHLTLPSATQQPNTSPHRRLSRRARRSRRRAHKFDSAAQQWLQHLHPPRSARIHPQVLCMVLCTTTTNPTLHADPSAQQHKPTLTDL